jgi:gamma-glutamylcyclotransferase (GGCT)/AIG2-like uncharacterized protein YtfP
MVTKADITNSSYLVLYGSLMSSFPTQEVLGLQNRMILVGQCKLHGKLYDLGEYPGLIIGSEGNQLVSAELYRFADPEILSVLDDFEDYKAGNEQESLYIRVLVNVHEPFLKAWVYVYNRNVSDSKRIKHGSWENYLLAKKP